MDAWNWSTYICTYIHSYICAYVCSYHIAWNFGDGKILWISLKTSYIITLAKSIGNLVSLKNMLKLLVKVGKWASNLVSHGQCSLTWSHSLCTRETLQICDSICKTRHNDACLEIQLVTSASSIYVLFCSNINVTAMYIYCKYFLSDKAR